MRISQKLLEQIILACLQSLEYVFQTEPKYGKEILKFETILKIFENSMLCAVNIQWRWLNSFTHSLGSHTVLLGLVKIKLCKNFKINIMFHLHLLSCPPINLSLTYSLFYVFYMPLRPNVWISSLPHNSIHRPSDGIRKIQILDMLYLPSSHMCQDLAISEIFQTFSKLNKIKIIIAIFGFSINIAFK